MTHTDNYNRTVEKFYRWTSRDDAVAFVGAVMLKDEKMGGITALDLNKFDENSVPREKHREILVELIAETAVFQADAFDFQVEDLLDDAIDHAMVKEPRNLEDVRGDE